MTYEIRGAGIEQAKDVLNLLYPHYYDESIQKKNGLTFDMDTAIGTVLEWIEGCKCVVAYKDGKPVGFMVWYFIKTVFEEQEADLVMFFVMPKERGTGLSRDLAKIFDEDCKAGGVKAAYNGSSSGVSDKLYHNLFAKYGFDVLGTELVKFYE